MKTTLQEKLKAYSLTAGSFTLAATASGQMVYTDINPDTILTTTSDQTYDLDFNNDGTPELSFYSYDAAATYPNYFSVFIKSSSGDSAAIRGTFLNSNFPDLPYPLALNMGDSIKASDPNWVSYANSQYLGGNNISYTTYSNWQNQTDKYMAVRFEISGQIHYGWVRMTLNSGDSLTIKDYAYETTPDVGIVAGQGTPTSIANSQEVLNPQVHVFDRILFVNLPAQAATEGNIRLFNTAGQLIQNVTITDSAMRIALNGLATGIYFVQIEQNGQSTSRKIYVH